MAGEKTDIQTPVQFEMWKLLGSTQAVVDATGDRLVRPGKVSEPHATDPARFDAQRKGRGTEATGSLPAGRMAGTETWAAKGLAKSKFAIVPARHGNRSVLRRRD